MSNIDSASHVEKLSMIHAQRDEIARLRAINAELVAALEEATHFIETTGSVDCIRRHRAALTAFQRELR